MKKFSIIFFIILVALVFNPTASALQQIENDNEKTGDVGKEVVYKYVVKNDKDYSVDILVEIIDYDWEVVVDENEKKNVPRKTEATFTFTVFIPECPESVLSTTLIRFSEKEHKPIIDDYSPILSNNYQWQFDDNLITHHSTESDAFTPSEAIISNSFLLPILAFSSLIFGYLWYGRKYYFLTPFYMTIPKEKLLDHENREKISQYLTVNNGSNLSEISQGTGIHLQTLRHHMHLFEQSNLVLKKDKRFFIRKPGSDVFDTEILSPVLQRVFEIIRDNDGITMTKLVENTKRSKPWIGNRINDLLVLNLIEIVTIGRFKYIYPLGQSPEFDS